MSGSGVFNLLTNDGKADKLIMATDFLNRRMQHVMCARKAAGEGNPMPTLQDIEKTHLLFVNAHFKPFCALGFEYQKVRSSTGSPTLNSTIQFAIPQFGDFFADMVMRVTMPTFASSVQTSPTATAGTAFPLSATGTAATDWDGTTVLSGATATTRINYSLVDPFGNAVTAGYGYRNLVRYVEYPAERLCQSVKFEVNGNALDYYEDVAAVMVRKFTLPADKAIGYKRLCGQEVSIEGVSGVQLGQVFDNQRATGTVLTSADATAVPTGAPSVFQNQQGGVPLTSAVFLESAFPDEVWNVTAAAAGTVTTTDLTSTRSATVGYQSVFRKELSALDGLQTPKYQQPSTDLWCKLRFWFNERLDQAIPSVAIPSGQRWITVNLASQDLLVVEAPGLYVKRVIDTNASLTSTSAINNTRVVEYRPYISAGTITGTALTNVELYVNNLFVNPEIHDIYINRIGFSLIRVFRMHKQICNTATTEEKLLSQLKWPIEYMFVGLRPVWNITSTNTTMHRDWHRMCKIVDIEARDCDKAETLAMVLSAGAQTGSSASVTGNTSRIHKLQPDRYTKSLKTFDILTLTAHGVKIFDQFSEKFFSTYMPYAFGGPNIVSPVDEGCLMFTFSLYPGAYQPSGHMNVSRAREFYLSWTSAYTSTATIAELIIVCKAINFLLIANGSAVLRFTT